MEITEGDDHFTYVEDIGKGGFGIVSLYREKKT
jgi:hypothetical protein